MLKESNIIFLHGALGTKAQFDFLLSRLRLGVHRLDFEGHGDAPPRDRPFRMEHFAENVLEYMDAAGITQAKLFGYSMGGYVALYLARAHPDRVSSVFTLATKLDWSPEVAAKETAMLDADRMLAKVPRFAESLQGAHTAQDWRAVLDSTREMLLDLGSNNRLTLAALADIQQPVRIAVGDRDTTVTLEECIAAYRALPNAQLQVFPNTPHPLDRVSRDALASALAEFFELDELR